MVYVALLMELFGRCEDPLRCWETAAGCNLFKYNMEIGVESSRLALFT